MIILNNKRRASLKDAVALLDRAAAIIEQVAEQEQDCLDNIPENLQESDRYEAMETAVDCLEDAAADLESAKEKITEASV